ncbi:ATP-binding cassette domain-containing protein [Streptomyces tsukubensis]|uniref:Multidrug ABC transporter ATP-binding protein n=1 Tax=Streptomyces tsukubensis TaxID=83656 RepID=A0A1V4A1V0_9ACTN|nr:ATP-binding cassette domain-containing protein [Streptomyces tsukubensis]OON72506.1 multidrug ABC transporter ATP-binding protein [Streptomyces tsukubensis]QFR93629.1 ATP-binding cassette domain-containing protein [Streptomyces tsukubensis]
MLTLRGLTKRYGGRTAVDALTVDVVPGKVTGFLGPNGAGKSTTMRMILGLDRPTSGTALINGKRYGEFAQPLREVGALLDARAAHPRRTARGHLLAMASSQGMGARRVAEVLDIVGLTDVAGERAGSYSLGMAQRLGIAGALLGDPGLLLLDEPVNGLDPDGVRWIRTLLRTLAGEGRTVLVSSHLMSEMERTADRLVVIGKGRLIAEAPVTDILARGRTGAVTVRGPEPEALRAFAGVLTDEGARVRESAPGELDVTGLGLERVGDLAHERHVRLHELRASGTSLESAYMRLTSDAVEYGQRPTPTAA